MRYVGRLKTNGKVFDSNLTGKPFSFRLGECAPHTVQCTGVRVDRCQDGSIGRALALAHSLEGWAQTVGENMQSGES